MKNNPKEAGRLVPSSVVAGNHIDSWNVIKRLRTEGKDIRFIDNSFGKDGAKRVSFEELDKKISYPSKEELTKQFNARAKELFDEGIITEEQYKGYTGEL